MPCGSLRHIPRVVEVVRQSLHGPQLCLGEPLPRVRTRCNCWLDQARRCHEEAGQQTHQYVHADCVSNCMANGVLLHTVTCQELVEFLHGETLQPAQFLVVQRIGCIGDEFAEEDPGLPTHAPTTSKGILKAPSPAPVATLAPGPPRLVTAPL